MPLFEKTLSDYLEFGRVMFIATLVVGLTRLVMSLAGVPDSITAWFSLTAVMLIAMFYFSIRTHTAGFGSYKHLLVLLVLQILLAEVITATGIALTAVTGVENIFSSGSQEPNHWAHAAQHLFGGPTVFALLLWLPASLVHFVTKKTVGASS